MFENIAIIGAGGAIGSAFAKEVSARYSAASVHCFSRQGSQANDQESQNQFHHTIDYEDEASIKLASETATNAKPLDLVFVSVGILHDETMMPEKSLKDMSAEKFRKLFEVNTILPAIIAKHFVPKLHTQRNSYFAALSARVGSISDNHLGGWYAYRASKAALNMTLKNCAIEAKRKNTNAIIVGMHPGTVDSNLSKPFQKNVPAKQLFTPQHSAQQMLQVLESLSPEMSGKCFAFDGKEIIA